MHKSVLLQESINLLNLKSGMTVIDATVGAGGHSRLILEKIGKGGRLLGLDKDQKALELAKENLGGCSNLVLAHSDFTDIEETARKLGFQKADAILADIGVSSMQLDEAERGFSFNNRAKLDMRMDRTSKLTAADVVNEYTEEELSNLFKKYGEEPDSKRIAKAIIEKRENHPILYTDELSEVVRGVKGPRAQARRIDPATKVFQALRIEVNGELEALESALPQMVRLLNTKGRIAVISFHSLEDRIVKNFIDSESRECICPPDFPKCVCNNQPLLKRITKKPVIATVEEIRGNPRARSAKLRVAEKL